MKKIVMSITAAVVMAAMTLTSCMKTETVVPAVTADDAITFGTFMDQTTKGTIYHTSDMEVSGFGIMGYYTSQNAWADATPEFMMYNQLVTYNEVTTAWTYDPVKYWSNISGDKYSFFAYAPYATSTAANGCIAVSDNESTDVPVVSFTVHSDATKMVDFVAGQEIDQTQTEDVIRLDLKHQLTRVSFSAKTDITTDASKSTDATYVVIKDMDIDMTDNFYMSGDYTFDTDNTTVLHDDHDQDGVWGNLVAATAAYDFSGLLAYTDEAIGSTSEVGGYTTSGVRVANTDAETTSLFTTGEYLFLLPPNGQDGIAADGDITITVAYDIVTADASLAAGYSVYDTKVATVIMPVGALKQGRAYDILLTFDLTEIKVAGNVILWDESEIDEYGATTGLDEEATEDDGEDDEDDVTTYNPSFGFTAEAPETMTVGDTFTFAAAVTDGDPEVEYTIVYTINDVEFDGVFTPTVAGTYTVKATTLEDATLVDDVVVVVSNAVTGVEITGAPESEILVGTEMTLGVDIEGEQKTLTAWDSSDKSVATIDADGNITAVGAGTTTITVAIMDADGDVITSDSFELTVYNYSFVLGDVDGFDAVKLSSTLPAYYQTYITSSTLPENAELVYTSSNTAVATVDADGKVTLLSASEDVVTITATYEATGASASMTILVGGMSVDETENASGDLPTPNN